jgi:cell division protein FtsW
MRLNTTFLIFVTTLMLVSVGVVMVYSSSAAIAARETIRHEIEAPATAQTRPDVPVSAHSFFYLIRQAVWAGISIIAMLVAYRIDYETYKRWATPLLAFSFLCLILVYVPHIGVSRKGAHRWIGFGGYQVQASEIAKLALIIYMAKKLCERQAEIRSFIKGFFPSLVILGVFLVAIVLEPDLGATVVIGLIMFAMWFVAGMRLVHLVTLVVAAIPCVIVAIIAEPYRVRRLIAFLNPESDIRNTGWQLYQSLVGVATGGIAGLGLGRGPQKYLFLSEAYTDFIFAIICEELGMIGAICIIGLYCFFFIQGMRVALRAPDLYSCLLATGCTCMIGFQAFINMGVVTGLLPTKGLTLPLISYGGSSLLINMVGIGILMNVSRNIEIAASMSRRAPNEGYP